MKSLITFLAAICYFPLFAQVFVLENGSAIPWSESQFSSGPETDKSFERLEAAIYSIQKAEMVCMVDSLVINIQTKQQGDIEYLSKQFSLSNSHQVQIIETLKSCRFVPNKNFDLLFRFAPKYDEPNIFDLDKTPKIGACWRNGNEGNLLFEVSCFNYHITEKVFDVLNKLRSKTQTEEGPLTGTVWFNNHGEVKQIELNPACFNPRLNDLAANALAELKIKKGAEKNDQKTGFHVELESILLVSNNVDVTNLIQEAEEMFSRNNLDSALFDYSLANSFGAKLSKDQINELGYCFHALGFKGRAQSIWQENEKMNVGEYLTAKRLKDTIFLEKSTYVGFPANFDSCQTAIEQKAAYDCFYQGLSALVSKELNGKIQFIPNDRNIECDFTIDANGNVKSIRLSRFSLSRKNNLLALKAISKLPQLIPAREGNVAVSMSYSLPININPSP